MSLEVISHTAALVRKEIRSSTEVTFPNRETKGQSKVLDAARLVNGKIALLLERTPFHPVDKKWADQPADRGTLTLLSKPERSFVVEDCQILAVHKETQKVAEITEVLKKDRDAWHYTVAHVIDPKEISAESLIGRDVQAEVDAIYRASLSLHHTACHLTAFALNRATAGFWNKEAPRRDSLGSPHFDQLAIERTSIFADRAEDVYRLGKSINKNGLQVEKLLQGLPEIEKTVNQMVADWIATGAKVEIFTPGPALEDMRTWHCQLPPGVAEMPCGGSHVRDLSVFTKITYRLRGEREGQERRLFAFTEATPSEAGLQEEKKE